MVVLNFYKIIPLIKELLFNINQDKDGSYFICEENKELIEELKRLLDVK